MNGRNILIAALAAAVSGAAIAPALAAPERKPNVIFILADDLGYGDLGCYGQKRIQTPNIDQLAASGMRFTQAYAGSTVCAPSRCCLMTGKHTGHATIRGNGLRQGQEVPLRADETALPEVFKTAGYATALMGKWGVGENGSAAAPNRKGFDEFFGYLTQHGAHNYYPEYLWHNDQKFPLPGNAGGKHGQYTHDLIADESLKFIRSHSGGPFFLYLAVTLPHANNEARPNGMQIPSFGAYAKEDWPRTEKGFAAMVTRLDSDVGRIVALLKELHLDDNTLVIFVSDNGPHSEGGHNAAFFESSGGLRGIKRDLYEGGIRVPLIAAWPGHIKPGTVSEQLCAFWDVLPTMTDLLAAAPPTGLDGISILPVLLGQKPVIDRGPLYWEFYERGGAQAVRLGDWKAVRPIGKPLELYDLKADRGEQHNLAVEQGEIAQKMAKIMDESRTPSPDYHFAKDAPATEKAP